MDKMSAYYKGELPMAEVVGPWRKYPRAPAGRPPLSRERVRRRRVVALLTDGEYAAMERWGIGAGHEGPGESARVAIRMAAGMAG